MEVKRPYYTETEVENHCFADDCWVCLYGDVLDLTNLIQSHLEERPEQKQLLKPLLRHAGKDVSHFFKRETKEEGSSVFSPKHEAQDFDKNRRQGKTEQAMKTFLHMCPEAPLSTFDTLIVPWWEQRELIIGHLTEEPVVLQLMNTLLVEQGCDAESRTIIEAAKEESLEEIGKRYLPFNAHANAYVWKVLQQNGRHRILDMEQTLEENGIEVRTNEVKKLGLKRENAVITIFLSYKDDAITAAPNLLPITSSQLS